MRPGRFDRQIYVPAPDIKGRASIFKVGGREYQYGYIIIWIIRILFCWEDPMPRHAVFLKTVCFCICLFVFCLVCFCSVIVVVVLWLIIIKASDWYQCRINTTFRCAGSGAPPPSLCHVFCIYIETQMKTAARSGLLYVVLLMPALFGDLYQHFRSVPSQVTCMSKSSESTPNKICRGTAVREDNLLYW